MKKNGILNADLARIVAGMGHTDRLVICDAGLPIPSGSAVVDLALTTNIPRFIDALRIVLEELQVEEAVVANEMQRVSNGLFESVRDLLKEVEMKTVPHERFKDMMRQSGNVWFVRTGEMTPYANIILISGVTF